MDDTLSDSPASSFLIAFYLAFLSFLFSVCRSQPHYLYFMFCRWARPSGFSSCRAIPIVHRFWPRPRQQGIFDRHISALMLSRRPSSPCLLHLLAFCTPTSPVGPTAGSVHFLASCFSLIVLRHSTFNSESVVPVIAVPTLPTAPVPPLSHALPQHAFGQFARASLLVHPASYSVQSPPVPLSPRLSAPTNGG